MAQTADTPLDPREARAARHLADAIAAGYRANLRRDSHDSPAFVRAVARELASRWGVSPEEALAELAQHHGAIV